MSEPRATVVAADPTRAGKVKRAALALIVAGGVLSLLALLSESGRGRFGFAYLLAFAFCWSIVLGSLFFVALQHVTRSVWSVVLRRVAETLASPMGLLAILFVPLALFAVLGGDFTVFPWTDPGIVDGDHVLEEKAPYLNTPFFVLRGVAFFLIWIVFAAVFVRRSLRQDDGSAGSEATVGMRRLAAPFLLIFALTMTFASFDWLMSLEPHWFSTIFGVYVFSGMTLAALAAITLAVVWMRARGWFPEDLVSGDHLYSLGTLLFAFTCFWAYIAFSQFMLIWYGNIPEETIYFVHRAEHGWYGVSVLLVLLRFVVPFFLLLGRGSKTNPRHLVAASVLVLAGQLVDLYWIIMPQAGAAVGPRLGWQELGPALLLVGLLLRSWGGFLGRHPSVAVGDPLLEKSRNFHLS